MTANRPGRSVGTSTAASRDGGSSNRRSGASSTGVVLTETGLAFASWQGRIGEDLYWGVWSIGRWELHPLALLCVASGTMMISKTLRIPKL